MARVAATRSGRSSSSVFRGVLSGVLLVTALIVGLVGMHTLNLHGTAAADAPTAVMMTAGESASTHHGTAQGHLSGNPTGAAEMSCAGCSSDDHAGAAMMCVLALLLVLVLLIAPGMLRNRSGILFQSPLIETLTARFLPRAPSLHVLCISRT